MTSVPEQAALTAANARRSTSNRPRVFISIMAVLIVIAIVFIASHSSSNGNQGLHEQQLRQDISPVLPNSESSFIEIVTTAQGRARATENDMQKGGVKNTRDRAICAAMTNLQIQDWIGTVKTIDSNSDGKGVLAISIAPDVLVQTWNNAFSDIETHTLIEPSSHVFESASAMKPGQLVDFSGTFIPGSEGDCVREGSLTLQGKLESPEFIFQFSEVSTYHHESSLAEPPQSNLALPQNSKPSPDLAASVPPNPSAETSQANAPVQIASGSAPSVDAVADGDMDTARPQISQALQKWSNAYESNDPNVIANCYADQVDRYFLRQGVTRAFIHDYLDTWLKEHGDRVSSFKIKDVTYESETPETVTIRLVKQIVTMGSTGAGERLTRSELSMRKVGGEWKITSERDFK